MKVCGYEVRLRGHEQVAALAGRQGQPVEAVIAQALAEMVRRAPDPLVVYMQRAGHVRDIPTGEPDTPEIAAERERLARSIMPGKLASEMVIEDCGPR